MRKTMKMLKDDSGVALMMALFTLTMMMVIASEIMYESNVEMVVSASSINQVKAHYAAKAGVELSLLRVHMFRKVSAVTASMQGALPPGLIDQLWQMPSAWPPPLPDDATAGTKDEIKTAVKKSYMKTQYFATIESEGSRIDVNDLGSPSPVIAAATRAQILQIFTARMETDEAFAKRWTGFSFEQLVNNIADWVDDDREGRNGGSENSLYATREGAEFLPPNTGFKTLDELHQVAMMNDDLYKMLAPRLTVFGTKGINVNHANKEVLRSLSEVITEERVNRILEARNDPNRGPFKDYNDFVQFLQSLGVNQDPFKDQQGNVTVPLIFESEINFRIISRGSSGKVQREITAIVYDFDRVRARLQELLPVPTPGGAAPGGATPPQGPSPTPSPTPGAQPGAVPNARPNIVYWNET